MANLFRKLIPSANRRELKRLLPLVERVNECEPKVVPLSDAALRARTADFRQRVENQVALECFETRFLIVV